MNVRKSFFPFGLIVLTITSYVLAETVDLIGKVQNQFGNPVEGAELKLLSDEEIVAITDSDGQFYLSGEITSVKRKNISELKSRTVFRGSKIILFLTKFSPVKVDIYNVSGKKVHDFNLGTLRSGFNVITVPVKQLGSGIYMIAVNFEGKRQTFKYVSSSGKIAGRVSSRGGLSEENSLQKSAVTTQVIIDSILVWADGYEAASYPVASYQQSGIVITLESTGGGSRLDNITKNCDGCMPPPISGGQSGWGSRYWDCCKPHCSWPENTNHYCANCDIDGVTEIDCFQEAGNEWNTWLQGTKSSCEGGEAFTCYSHVPVAVCENLAYGFAAVPGTNAACGKCFQLEFDGGFRHGEPKPAHALVKDKVMIVMASNIGHDVGGGQFDIMIPGGGMGNFVQGCARQWNVDQNDRALVGENQGGFTSYCQKQLGWDADPEDTRSCVRGMCDNLFGKDPALHDLWEGCIWYVEWMHAVDNPTFKYKEVECPQELIDLYYSSKHPKP
ncbi:MAG: T9SS type A sorting domain-containing protein [Fibrobacter sp.]|nr:T9SS type A sorting domain-containing protein [Fibrobacter sp.]